MMVMIVMNMMTMMLLMLTMIMMTILTTAIMTRTVIVMMIWGWSWCRWLKWWSSCWCYNILMVIMIGRRSMHVYYLNIHNVKLSPNQVYKHLSVRDGLGLVGGGGGVIGRHLLIKQSAWVCVNIRRVYLNDYCHRWMVGTTLLVGVLAGQPPTTGFGLPYIALFIHSWGS